MRVGTIETPWGDVTLDSVMQLRGPDRWASSAVNIRTDVGRAVSTFHIERRNDEIPERLRVVMLGGYGQGHTGSPPTGESTLKAGGASLGWRLQAYLDPLTGLVAPETEPSVMLVEQSGKSVNGFAHVEQKVRDAVSQAFEAARENDPGVFARLYAGLMKGMLADVAVEVEDASRVLAEATKLKDRATALMDAASDAAENVPAPVARP